MLETQFYTRLFLNIIIGIMFVFVMSKMATRKTVEPVGNKGKLTRGLAVFFLIYSIICIIDFITVLARVNYPTDILEPALGPNTIIRPSHVQQVWGAPTFEQITVLNCEVNAIFALGLAIYFWRFKKSNSKWWQKIVKVLFVILLGGSMMSATNLTYFDIWDLINPILFIVLWIIQIITCKKRVLNVDKTKTEAEDIIEIEEQNVSALKINDDNKDKAVEMIESDLSFSNEQEENTSESMSSQESVINPQTTPKNRKDKNIKKIIIWVIGIIAMIVLLIVSILYIIDDYIPDKRHREEYQEYMDGLCSDNEQERLFWSNDVIRYYDYDGIEGKYIEDRKECRQKAWRNIQELAEKGNAEAQFLLGLRYEYNFLKECWMTDEYSTQVYAEGRYNQERAAYWYLQAAEQEYISAQYNLSLAYEYGKGVKKDMSKAVYWKKKAAEHGYDKAQLQLGDFYRDGVAVKVGSHKVKKSGYYNSWDTIDDYQEIVEKDLSQAKYWWMKAAEGGNKEAQERLEKIYE